jgi:diguanylate cyclase (GGDEF)-like protein
MESINSTSAASHPVDPVGGSSPRVNKNRSARRSRTVKSSDAARTNRFGHVHYHADGLASALATIPSPFCREGASDCAQLREFADGLSAVVVWCGPDGRIVAANRQAAILFGRSVAGMVGKTAVELGPVADQLGLTTSTNVDNGCGEPAICVVDANNEQKWFDITRRSLPHSDSDRIVIATTAVDVSDRMQLQDKLAHSLRHDAVTGLPNLASILDTLELAFVCKEGRKRSVALLVVDLAEFTVINESLGVSASDCLLVTVAGMLTHCVSPAEVIARLTGGQFLVLLYDANRAQAVTSAKRILASIAQPIDLYGHTVRPTVRVGIALSAGVKYSGSMLQNAHTALRSAGSNGKGYATFDGATPDRMVQKLDRVEELRHAVERDQLIVEYQPIVDLSTGRIVELEALARWMDSSGEFVPPSEFIPIAEESGLIEPMGEWVSRTACRQLTKWQQQFAHHGRLGMSINLSVTELRNSLFVRRVLRMLEQLGLENGSLTLEVTENIGIAELEPVLDRITALHSAGVRIAIDDFGTGYSSMISVARLPLSTLKIDREFTARIGVRSEDDAIARSIVNLGRALHLRVTAEGVETWEQLSHMRSLGCDCVQGYLLAKPLDAERLTELLSKRAPFSEIVGSRHGL